MGQALAAHKHITKLIAKQEGLSTPDEALFLIQGLNVYSIFPDWIALNNGTTANDVLDALEVAVNAGVPSVVMTYWNPIEKFGVKKFADAIASRGGSGVIHPDITIEESGEWLSAVEDSAINPIYVVALSTSDDRLAKVTAHCGGLVSPPVNRLVMSPRMPMASLLVQHS